MTGNCSPFFSFSFFSPPFFLSCVVYHPSSRDRMMAEIARPSFSFLFFLSSRTPLLKKSEGEVAFRSPSLPFLFSLTLVDSLDCFPPFLPFPFFCVAPLLSTSQEINLVLEPGAQSIPPPSFFLLLPSLFFLSRKW